MEAEVRGGMYPLPGGFLSDANGKNYIFGSNTRG